jgi:predicted Zn-dependent peptidase
MVAATLGIAVIAATSSPAAISPELRTLPNGLEVAVFRDARLPTVQLQVLVPAGAAQEPLTSSGVAGVTAQLLTRGTASRTQPDMAASIERLGGTLVGSAGREYATLSGAFLARDLEAGFELIADAVRNPIFPTDEMERARQGGMSALIDTRRNPGAVAEEHIWGLVFQNHAYARPPLGSFESLTELSRQQIQSFHRELYRPDRALLAIAGDVDPARAFALAEEHFGGWSGRSQAPATLPSPPAAAPRTRLVDLPGAPHVELRLGMVGPGRSAAEAPALMLAAWLFGESTRVPGGREAQASVGWQKAAALVSVAASSRPDSVRATLDRLRARLRRFIAQPPREADVAAAALVFAGGQSLSLDTPAGVIAQWMSGKTFGLADDHVTRFAERITATSPAAVHEAAKRWLDPDRMVLVAVGPAGAIRSQLEGAETIEEVGPTASPVAVTPLPSRNTEEPLDVALRVGRTYLEQTLAAHGGLDRLRRVKDSTLEADMTLMGEQGEVTGKITQVRKDPERFHFTTDFVRFTTTQVLNGNQAWSKGGARGDSIVDEDSLATGALRAGFHSDLIHTLLAAADPGAKVAYRGREIIGASEGDVLEVITASGKRHVLFLDFETHRVLAVEQNERSGPRVESVRRVYSDWRTVEGIVWPFREERLLNGEPTVRLAYRRVDFNSGVKDDIFQRPAAAPAEPERRWR